jgi:polyketide biosynthesis enoyl-CoA hydratase PksI
MGETVIECLRHEGGIAQIAMRDEAGTNAMSEAFVEALLANLRAATEWPELRVIVLSGLPEVFCSGASREVLVGLLGGRLAPADIVLPKVVLDLPVPVIAAMEGHAIGGGLALGICADILLIARESRYGASFMNMGFTPGMGLTELLTHVMTPALACELLFGGEPKKGSWFEGRSGFNAILPREQVLGRAMDLAARFAEKPRGALEILKRTLSLPRRQAFERTHTVESLMHRVSFASPEARSGIEESLDQ